MPKEERLLWSGMRTAADLRKEAGIKLELNKDSLYKPINRTPIIFAPLTVPEKLTKQLPFSSRPKNIMNPQNKPKRPKLTNPMDRKASSLINELSLIQKNMFTTRKLKRKKEAEEYNIKLKKIEEAQNAKRKVNQKKMYQKLGRFQKPKHHTGSTVDNE
ncbi:Ribosome biogenesis protein BMS1 [Thelohanellus kitauei]|uniref:Ribosome biogenesis protein BMS1 n=1 Tax=Thelohanellus kitauei TaxID=669202 RepID=A0A0C2N1C7_THEKT|nr:Ribosome biogenesis protein BMS1 [Thelohanellus kitauei]